MSFPNARPRWWQLYLTFPLLIALFVVDHQLNISSQGHQAVQIGIVLIVYGLISRWIKANSRAISPADQQYYGRFRVVQIHPSQIIDVSNEKYPGLLLPDSEVKGMLSDTFEMDCPDADALSIDDISHKIKKE